jgi:MFS family permease
MINNKKYLGVVAFLCLGYAVDFYDLTIFAASYPKLIPDLFNIYDITKIQVLYLNIIVYLNVGLLVGSILFGILGDKIGRTKVIRYSILIYSLSTILSIFIHNIPLFELLRFVAGVGLATEFATSSILINEMLPNHIATKYSGILYIFGVVGGMVALFINQFSWQMMFIIGGVLGIILFIIRKFVDESPLYLSLPPNITRGNIWVLINSWPSLIKILKLTALIMPFYFLIVVMFILPGFMHLSLPLANNIHTLLIYFFLGNIVSTIILNYLLVKLESFKWLFVANSIIFAGTLLIYPVINDHWFIVYSFIFGLIGGGLPSLWMQYVTRCYPTNHRSTASNLMFGLGRCGGTIFNILFAIWIVQKDTFYIYFSATTIIISIITIMIAIYIVNLYTNSMNYIQE